MSVTHRVDGRVAVVTIDRADRANSLAPETYAALVETVRVLDGDAEVRAIVVTAVGDRAFCAGLDLSALDADGADAFDLQRSGSFFPFVVTTPLIAAVNGAAVAGGFELVLACDLVVAADHARFGLPEVGRGLIAGGGGTQLSRRIPLVAAMEVVLTGGMVDARRAYEMGLVNRVVASEEVLEIAIVLAETIAANAPLSVALSKALLVEEAGLAPRARPVAERMDELLASDDAREGPRAFVERRVPRWTGR